MSTNNFKYENVLIACPDFNIYHDCEEEGMDCPVDCEDSGTIYEFDNFAFDEYVLGVQEKLETLGFDYCYSWDGDRSYPGRKIASFGFEDDTGMIKWLEVVIRSGYYSGMNIDYTIDGEFDESAPKSLHKQFDALVKKTEKVLRKCGEEMIKTGSFSNGEAVYKKKG